MDRQRGAAMASSALRGIAAFPRLPGAGPVPACAAELPVSLANRIWSPWGLQQPFSWHLTRPQGTRTLPAHCREPSQSCSPPPSANISRSRLQHRALMLQPQRQPGAVGCRRGTHHLPASALLSLLTFIANSSSSRRRFSSSTASSAASRP